jgi:hypothetical protein
MNSTVGDNYCDLGVEPGTMSNAKHRFNPPPSFCAEKNEKPRVPDTVQLGAISPFSAFLASLKISNLRVFNIREYSDSPRLHHIKASVINKLQRYGSARVPDEFHGRSGTGGGGNGITSTSSGIRYRKRMDIDG